MRTMFVFRNAYHAEEAGFRNGIHKNNRDWRACWPGCCMAYLMSSVIEAVIVGSEVDLGHDRGEGSQGEILKRRQSSCANPIWMEM